MKKTIPTLSEATRTVYKRQYNGTDSAKNFLTAMNHNIQAIGDIRVDKITTPVVNQMMDYLLFKLKNFILILLTLIRKAPLKLFL